MDAETERALTFFGEQMRKQFWTSEEVFSQIEGSYGLKVKTNCVVILRNYYDRHPEKRI